MKKKIIPVLFSMFLLAGCGEKKPEPCATHDYGEWEVKTAAICGAAGEKTRKCNVCGNIDKAEISALEHEYVDAADQTGAQAATCKDPGFAIIECKNCGAKTQRSIPATEQHSWGEWQSETAATHHEGGKDKRTCSVCLDTDYHDTEKDPNHVFSEVTNVAADHDMIGYTITGCNEDGVAKMTWDAKDINNKTKVEKYNNEENYKIDGEGIQFGGRPKGNGFGTAPSSKPSSFTFNADVPGSFLEYEFILSEKMENCQLLADMKSAQWLDSTAGLFLNAAEGNDWTPGMVAADNAKGYEIPIFRFDVYVNGKLVEMDATKNIAGEQQYNRDWYNFPCTVNFKKGENKIKFVMTGGWGPTFYNFGFITGTKVNDRMPQPSQGYEANFTLDSNIEKLTIYEDKACTKEADPTEPTYSRNEWGRKVDDGSGQISFGIDPVSGYKVKEIKVTGGAYGNVKNPADTTADNGKDNVYRITKIEDDINVQIITEEETVVYEGYEVTFVPDEHVTVEIYNSKSCADGTKVTGLVATSLDESTLNPTKSGGGQVYFKMIFEEGYELDTHTAPQEDVTYKNIKLPADTKVENGYRLTKVSGDFTFEIHSKSSAAAPTGFTYTFVAGEHINIQVYTNKDFSTDSAISGSVAVSRDKDNPSTLTKVLDQAQIWVKITADTNYVVDIDNINWGEGSKPYKSIKLPAETGVADCYTFTKVNSDATITINAKAAA